MRGDDHTGATGLHTIDNPVQSLSCSWVYSSTGLIQHCKLGIPDHGNSQRDFALVSPAQVLASSVSEGIKLARNQPVLHKATEIFKGERERERKRGKEREEEEEEGGGGIKPNTQTEQANNKTTEEISRLD